MEMNINNSNNNINTNNAIARNPLSSNFLSPSRTLVTSFSPKGSNLFLASSSNNDVRNSENNSCAFDEGDWVLCVTGCSSGTDLATPWIGCALSNGEIQVYDQNRLHLLQTYQQTQQSHDTSFVTDLVQDVSNPNALIASATDGSVTIFDIRQRLSPTSSFQLPRVEEEALSVSVGFGGTIAAVGTNKAKIHFLDTRMNKNNNNNNNNNGHVGNAVVGSYNQGHTDEITRVRFQTLPSSPSTSTTTTTTSTLLSAAEDGLICVYDTSQPTEEAAIQNVLSVQSPVREVGFFGPQSEGIYCLTGSESLLLYHKDDSNCQMDFGPNFRQHLMMHQASSTAPITAAQPQFASHPLQPQNPIAIDYLVDCHWDNSRQQLELLAGNAQGESMLYSVMVAGGRGTNSSNNKINNIQLQSICQGGHRGVIRGWNHLSADRFVTVGEDARICEWNRHNHQQHTTGTSTTMSTTTTTTTMVDNGHNLNGKRNMNTLNGNHSHNRPLMSRFGGGKVRRPKSRMSAKPY